MTTRVTGVGRAGPQARAVPARAGHHRGSCRDLVAEGAPGLMDVPAADAVPLHVEVDGAGPVTVVLAHGWTLDATTWAPVARSLDARVVRYDHRGHGRSAAVGPATMTIDQLADDLAAVVAAVAPEGPLVLGGHSMGGMAIMALAQRHPEVAARARGIALVATAAGGLAGHTLGLPPR